MKHNVPKPTPERLDELAIPPRGCDLLKRSVVDGRVGGVPVHLVVAHANGHKYTTTIVWADDESSYDGTLYIYKGKPRNLG